MRFGLRPFFLHIKWKQEKSPQHQKGIKKYFHHLTHLNNFFSSVVEFCPDSVHSGSKKKILTTLFRLATLTTAKIKGRTMQSITVCMLETKWFSKSLSIRDYFSYQHCKTHINTDKSNKCNN